MAKTKGLRNAFYLRGTVTAMENFSGGASRAVLGTKFTLRLDNKDRLVLQVFNGKLPRCAVRVGDDVYASGTLKVWKPRADKDGFLQLNVTDFRVLGKGEQEAQPTQADDDGNQPWGE